MRATRRHSRPVRVLLVSAAAASGLMLGPTAPPTQALPTQEEPTLPHSGDVAVDVDVFKADDGDVVDALNNLHGTSMHEKGLAIDFTCGGGTISRGSACFGWLEGHAGGYGLYNLPSEPWHWSTDGS